MRKVNVIILLFAIFSTTYLTAQTLRTGFQEVLENAADDIYGSEFGLRFGGVSTAFLSQPSGIITATSGLATPAIELNSSQQLGISDVSQFVLTLLTLALEEEGTLNLSSTIGSLVDVSNLTNISGDVTIEQLLKHESGFANFAAADNYKSEVLFDVTRNFTAEDVLNTFVGEANAAGTFNYANTNFLVLGLVLEAALGSEDLATALDRLVLTPAGVENIDFYNANEGDPADGFAPLFDDAFGTGVAQQLSPNTSIFTAASFAGNLLATPRQLLNLMDAVVQGEVLSEAQLQKMLAFNAIDGRASSQYGLGVEQFELDINGEMKTFIGHAGDVNYTSLLLYNVEEEIGVSMMSNNAFSTIEDLLNAAELYFETYEELRTTSTKRIAAATETIELYPNPTLETLFVEYELADSDQVQFQIVDLQGRILRSRIVQQQTGKQQLSLSVNDLPSGTYSLVLTTSEGTTAQLFVVR